MSRPIRIEFSGALYHVTSRGDRREVISEDEEDREGFLALLGNGWQAAQPSLAGNGWPAGCLWPEARCYDKAIPRICVSGNRGRVDLD